VAEEASDRLASRNAVVGRSLTIAGNVYDLRELNGAFGDLGTLVPFALGYITVTGLDPASVLTSLGALMLGVGLWFRTPMPVQPMKAIGAAAIAQAGAVTAGAVWIAGLFTGILWLVLGCSGAVTWIARLAGRPVVHGLVLGLGLTLTLEGVRMMARDPSLALVVAAGTFVLMTRPRLPIMLILLGVGAAVTLIRETSVLNELANASLQFRLPAPSVPAVAWADMVTGVLVLALPQAALTFGNAIVATVEENNSLFPHRPVTVRAIAIDHGLMNVVSAGLGGVPVCHGAGGMAGHVRFGARTGGALVLLGLLLLLVGLFLADSAATLLRLFPPAVLGVILLLGGLELASGVAPLDGSRSDRYVMLLTAAVGMWNMGVGFVAGLAVWWAARRGWPTR
jgi:MFS superfamily sulfate permease-like transporter